MSESKRKKKGKISLLFIVQVAVERKNRKKQKAAKKNGQQKKQHPQINDAGWGSC